MRYTSFERTIYEKVSQSIQDVTPGATIRAYHVGRVICDISVGQTQPYYDLASLTKIIFSQQTMMKAFDANLWNLESKVVDFLPDFFDSEMKIKSLLSHTSQLDWWKPFYTHFTSQEINESDWSLRRGKIYNLINNPENKIVTDKALYSDIGFILLGFVLEKIYEKNLLEIWQQTKDQYYPHSTFNFHVNNKPVYDEKLYAPTELNKIRGKVLRAEVHDDNTWAFGGVSSHAGLFGSIDDVAAYGLTLRSQLQGIANYSVRQKTAQLFAQRAIPESQGDWALGYMIPSQTGASCGTSFSKDSIGHTGFTGTSCWYDTQSDLLVVILSNRVNYGSENKAYIQLRPQIHNWLYEGIRKIT